MAGTPLTTQNVRDVLGVNQARRIVDMSPTIIMLEDDKKALTTFLTALGVRNVSNHRFDWLVDEKVPKTHTIGPAGLAAVPGAAGSPDTIDLSGLSLNIYLQDKDQLRVHDTGEQIEIDGPVADMSAVDVFRDIDGVVGVGNGAVAAGGPVTRVGNSYEENSTLRLPAGGTTRPTSSDVVNALQTVSGDAAGAAGTASGGINPTFGSAEWNFTQTFRDPVPLSRRIMQAKLHGGKERAHLRRKKLLEHAEKIENSAWHQARGVAVHNPNATLMGGMIWSIENLVSGGAGSNTFDLAGAPLLENTLNDFMRTFSRYGNTQRKSFFASRFVCDVVSGYLRDAGGVQSTYRLQSSMGKNKDAGVHVQSYTSGVGFQIDITPAHALEGIPGGLPTGFGGTVPGSWDGYGVLIDMENVRLAKYGNAFMTLEVDVQLPDQDGVTDSYLSDVGLMWGNPNHMGLLANIGV